MKEFFLDLLILIVSMVVLRINRIAGSIFVFIFFANLILRYRPYYYMLKANKTYAAGKKDEALSFYKKASGFRSSSSSIKITYGFLLLKMGHLDEADKMLSDMLNIKKMAPRDKYKAKMSYALVLWKKDRLDEAIELLYEVYNNYKNITLYETLGFLLIIKGDFEKAVKFNEEAYDYDKNDVVILDNLGQNYYLLGENEKALQIYKTLHEKNPQFPEAYYNYGLVLLKMGEKEKALENMERALKYTFTCLSTVAKEEVENKISEISKKSEPESDDKIE